MNDLNILTLDYETFYAVKYSLKQLGVISYVRDPRFKAHGFGVKWNDDPTDWVTHKDIPKWVASVDWANTFMVCHNTPFDGFINTEHYAVPHGQVQYTDTLSMARAIFPAGMKLDLDNIARILGVGRKTEGLLVTKGIRDLPPDLEQTLAEYCINDVDVTYKVFKILYPNLPQPEHDLLHLHLRMACEPELLIDRPLAQRAYDEEVKLQADLIEASGYSKTRLGSNPQFQELLEKLGIEVPMKTHPKTGKESTAFGKDDLAFKTMIADHPEHKALFEGRMAAKSNIGITRAKRWLDIHDAGKGTLPMPLKYYGAHTGRSSGSDGINVQNLPRIYKNDPESGKLRKSIIAPEGYVIAVADSSQIEMRMNMWLAGQEDMLDVFRSGKDPYCHTASNHFGYPVDKSMQHERFFGKMLDLALGFGMGWRKLRANAAVGFMGCPAVRMSQDESQDAVNKYRTTKVHVKEMWDYLTNAIPAMYLKTCNTDYKCIEFRHEAIVLPNGMSLQYPLLSCVEGGDWLCGIGREQKKIYGGILDENIVQALARIVVFEQMLEIDRTEGLHVVSSTHDEVIALVREQEAKDAVKYMEDVMSVPPGWAPDLPLAAEGGFAQEYSK